MTSIRKNCPEQFTFDVIVHSDNKQYDSMIVNNPAVNFLKNMTRPM